MSKLPLEFYTREDVVAVAKELLGKELVTNFDGQLTSGIITETEAYRAPDDRACHAYNNRRTPRTEIMFHQGGCAYIYLCYGIHHLFNVVTGPKDMAHAVLIRAIEPLRGMDIMQERRGQVSKPVKTSLTTGPGAMSQALGLHYRLTGQDLMDNKSAVWIEDSAFEFKSNNIASGKRIGVDYAGVCAEWPWRFWLKNSKWHK